MPRNNKKRSQSLSRPFRQNTLTANVSNDNLQGSASNSFPDDTSSDSQSIPDGQIFSKRKSRFSKTQKNSPIPKLVLIGKVIRVSDTLGFLKPLMNLPIGYPQDKNVFFVPKNVKSGGVELIPGDVLEFVLGTQDKARPFALSVRLKTAARRSEADVEQLLTKIQDYITSDSFRAVKPKKSSKEKVAEESSTKTDYFLDLVTCEALWELIGNSASVKVVDKIVKIILLMETFIRSMPQNFRNVLTAFSKTSMFSRWTGTLYLYIMEQMQSRRKRELGDVRNLLLLMFKNVPEKTHTFISLIKAMISDNKDSLENFLYLALKEIARFATDDLDDMEWSDLPLVPTVKEMTNKGQEFCSNIRPIMLKGAYGSVNEYIDTYFRLLRADCFGSLCKHLQEFLGGKLDHRDMSVYHSVKLAGISVTPNIGGVAVMLNITPAVPVKNWAISSKLMFGNLLCISPTGTFRDPIWATVVCRDIELLKKQCILVELCTNHNNTSNAESIILMSQSSGNMVMVESPTYYHAYKPVLQALQSMDPQELPFQEELVQGKFLKKLPIYISDFTKQALGKHEKSNWDDVFYNAISKTWPKTLDQYQLAAMNNTFLRRISCVQGPPGTGKTFIGIHIVRTILDSEFRPESPILVLTYKNHALDEFLKELQKYYPDDVVRVGGRSKDPDLEQINMNERKKNTRKTQALYDRFRDKFNEIDLMRFQVTKCANALDKNLTWSPNTFIKRLSKEQIASLFKGCIWKGWEPIGKTAEKTIPQILLSFSSFTGEHHMFFSDVNRRTAFDFALQKWMPSKKEVKDEEVKIQTNSSVIYEMLEKYKSTDGEKESMFDEKDIEDLQKERMAAANYTPLKSFSTIKMANSNNSAGFLNFLNIDGYIDELSSSSITNATDLWALSTAERIKFIQCLLLEQINDPAQQFEDCLLQYERLCAEKNELDDQHKIAVLGSMKIIGMTITGACINANILTALKPAIVIVEEAAEVLEAQILATLGPWVQHLIMIGDHKQLRPPVENYELAKKFHMEISMMERLINNKIKFSSLAMQNRMRPEFAALLLDIYPKSDEQF